MFKVDAFSEDNYNTLYVTDFEEVFYEVYQVRFGDSEFVLEGKQIDNIHTVLIDVEGYGQQQVVLRKGDPKLVLTKKAHRVVAEKKVDIPLIVEEPLTFVESTIKEPILTKEEPEVPTFTVSAVSQDNFNVLFVDELEEVFFEVYKVKFGSQEYMLEGKSINGIPVTKIKVENRGEIEVALKKGTPGLVLTDKSQNTFKETSVIIDTTEDIPSFVPTFEFNESDQCTSNTIKIDAVIREPQIKQVVVEKEIVKEVKVGEDELYTYIDNKLENVKNNIGHYLLTAENLNSDVTQKLAEYTNQDKSLAKQIDEAIKLTTANIDNTKHEILNSVSNVIDTIVNDTNSAFNDVNNKIEVVEDSTKLYQQQLSNISSDVNLQLEQVAQTVGEQISNVKSKVGKQIKTTLETVNNLKERVTDAEDTVRIVSSFNDKISQLETIVTETASSTNDNVQKIRNETISLIESVSSEAINLNSTLTEEVNLITNQSFVVSNIVNEITTQLETLQPITLQVEGLGNTITLIDSKFSTFEEVVNVRLTTTNTTIDEIKQNVELYKTQLDVLVEDVAKHSRSINSSEKKVLTEVDSKIQLLETSFKQLVLDQAANKLTSLEPSTKSANSAITKKDITDIRTQIEYIKRVLATVGGGSVAVQYANGGTMNGNLNINGKILSGGIDISTLFGKGGGGTIIGGNSVAYYGSFYDTTSQPETFTTVAYPVNIGSTVESSGVSITNGNRIVFANAGTYNIQFSIQYINTSNEQQDVDVWFRKNGIDIPQSNSIFTVPAKKNTATPGKLIAITPFIVSLTANEYVQLMWNSQSLEVTISPIAAQTNPTIPEAPSVIVLVEQITAGDTAVDSLVHLNSGYWNSSYTTLTANSANWSTAYQYSTAYNISASNYNSVYSTVQTNSAITWNYQGTDLKNLSANWQNSFTTLTANSANWNSVWTTVCSFSAGWGTGVTGTGTTNYIPKWTSSKVLDNSNIIDNGSQITVNLPFSTANIISIKDVQFTGNTSTATSSTTALNTFIEVKVNGVSKYLRLYDIQ